jgi:uncharacterized protein (DUF4213/DUF364 family)
MASDSPARPLNALPLRQAIVQSLQVEHSSASAPRVVEVFPPPGGGREQVSAFTFVVLDDGSVGMAYNLVDGEEQRRAYDAHDFGSYVGWDGTRLAAELLADDPTRRIVGYAACVALSQRSYRHEQPEGLDTTVDLMGVLNPGKGDCVGVVGYARRMVRQLLGRQAQVAVVERRELDQPEGVAWSPDPALLEGCNKVLITSSTILNDTLDDILGHCQQASWRALYGPGAAVWPEALVARGINALGGLLVTDGSALVERQRAGQKWREAKQEYVLLGDRAG